MNQKLAKEIRRGCRAISELEGIPLQTDYNVRTLGTRQVPVNIGLGLVGVFTQQIQQVRLTNCYRRLYQVAKKAHKRSKNK